MLYRICSVECVLKMSKCIHRPARTRASVHTLTHKNTHTQTHKHTNTHAYTHTQKHTHTHTNTHKHTHIHTQAGSPVDAPAEWVGVDGNAVGCSWSALFFAAAHGRLEVILDIRDLFPRPLFFLPFFSFSVFFFSLLLIGGASLLAVECVVFRM